MDPGPFAGIMSLSLEGVAIPYFPVALRSANTLFGANVSAFAGQTALLEFSLSRLPQTDFSDWNIDSIEFSSTLIPEPSILSLSALAITVLICRRNRNRQLASCESCTRDEGSSLTI
jgi:hypothetical protein